MKHLRTFSDNEVAALVRHRPGEAKLGARITVIGPDAESALSKSGCRFVLLGIPEDIGVRANQGRAGAATAVQPAIDSILNLQSNSYLDGTSIALLGEVDVEDLSREAEGLDQRTAEGLTALRELVVTIDSRVTDIIRTIVAMGRIPIVVGGGHNNSYGCIKGASLALGKPLNVINCDQHLDFREAEGRHSGNGFTYAFNEGWLGKYVVYGTHEQYNNAAALSKFMAHPASLYHRSYESVFVREEVTPKEALLQCFGFLGKSHCGIEIDLDSIINVPSSARSSSGMGVAEARQFIYRAASLLNPAYLHIAEGAPVLAHRKADYKTGKLIAYLVSDFIKGIKNPG
jgi:formiminoglutamase